MFLEWTKELEVGVDVIDNQHKELFDRVNKFFDAIKNIKGKDEVLDTLNFLEEYVVVHFNAEEDYMKKIKYSGYDMQHDEHEKFKKELKELKTRFETSGAGLSVVLRTHLELSSWLRKHIVILDKQIGKHNIIE